MIEKSRIQYLNKKPVIRGKYVIYWMQASQRTEFNHALEYAAMRANELGKPLVVFFGISNHYPLAGERHYVFMLEGLKEVRNSLLNRGIKFVVRNGSPEMEIKEAAANACLVVTDRGYTRIQRYWRKLAAESVGCMMVQVESDVIIPIETVSPKEEYSAATIRGKIHKLLPDYLRPWRSVSLKKDSLRFRIESISLENVEALAAALKIDRAARRIAGIKGGMGRAGLLLRRFVSSKLKYYSEAKNDPGLDGTSNLSPYLHFGQISPLAITLEIGKRRGKGVDEFLEELVVRRELSMNFVFYNSHHDSFESLPEWCRKTLLEHERDKREYLYSREELVRAATHDPYWNAAQKELIHLGRISGYMRMYWGKKILEWSESPVEAYKTALYLNDKYGLDGRDPNGYAGIAWCFGKHDRPWANRPIFGTVRYMNAEGLKRKFDADRYLKMVEQKCRESENGVS